MTENRGPLRGVRVTELGGIGPGPFGTMLLADMGADVVRIDRPPAGEQAARDAVLGRGKRSIALDLKDPDDLDAARSLIARSDVVIDPMRPGVAERIGIGPDDCLAAHPRLIYARMTGWGQDGPLAQRAGHDINYIALAGALHPMGPADAPPVVPLNLVGDYGGGGMLLALGVAAALVERERSGRGQVIDVAMVDGAATLMAVFCQLRAEGRWSPDRGTNWLDGSAHWYRTYETADGGYISVGALEPQFYAVLLETLELDPAEWPQWESDRWPALRDAMATIFRRRTRAEWERAFEGRDACFAPVLELEEAAVHPHLAARGTLVDHDGTLQPAPAPRFSRTPGTIGSPGQDSEELRREAAQ